MDWAKKWRSTARAMRVLVDNPVFDSSRSHRWGKGDDAKVGNDTVDRQQVFLAACAFAGLLL
jgi:hypothetical protein